MGHVSATQIVGRYLCILVGSGLVVEYASSSKTVVYQGEVELRRDVLGGQQVEVVRLPVLSGQEGSEIAEFGIRGLGIVHDHVGRSVAPALQGLVERHLVLRLSVEPVVILHWRSGNTEPCGVDILPQERIIVETVVEIRVDRSDGKFVELLLVGPLQQALVLQRVGKGEGVQDAGCIGTDAVPDRPKTVFSFLFAVHLGDLLLGELLHAHLLPLLLGKPGVPALVFELLAQQGV